MTAWPTIGDRCHLWLEGMVLAIEDGRARVQVEGAELEVRVERLARPKGRPRRRARPINRVTTDT